MGGKEMTDEELCKALRAGDHFEKVMCAKTAADRIEALVEAIETAAIAFEIYEDDEMVRELRATLALIDKK